jgi:hypothetical protein
MKGLKLLLVGCVGIGGQIALADDPLDAIRAACAGDAQKLCAGVPFGGGRIVACLKQHQDALSNQCKLAAAQVQAANPGNGVAPSNSAPQSTPAPAAAAPAAVAAPAAAKPSVSVPKNAAAGAYLRMKQVQVVAHVVDAKLGSGTVDLPALDLLIPSTWDFTGSVLSNTTEGCFRDLYAMSWNATSPDGSVAFQGAPNDSWQYADDPAVLKKLLDPTRRQIGMAGKPCPVSKPTSAEDYFRKHVLPQMPSGSSVVSVEPFPALDAVARKQLGLAPGDAGNRDALRTDAVRARIESQKDGKPVESWIGFVVVTRTYSQGRGAFYDCRAIDLMAMRAPKGKLDDNDSLYKIMIGSTRPEAKWQSYSNGEIAKYYELEARKEAYIDKVWAAVQQKAAETIMGEVAYQQQGSYNAAFGVDQNIRGVQTFKDPTTGGTMELSNLYDHAWLNGSNEYIMSDDPNFDPNGRLSGSWNQLQAVRPAP